MLSKKIEEGSVFIVFDLEWNQPIGGREYAHEVSELTGEIIEIGAVKYVYENGHLNYRGVFSRDVKPKIYTRMHYHVKKVTGKTTADLRAGVDFKDAYEEFSAFCGNGAILAGWGNSDTDMLKMNLKFFGMDDKLGMFFIDVQPIFSLFSGEKGRQRSVEFAVDYYGIGKSEEFHSATSDAKYTGAILEKIFEHNRPTEVLSAISSSTADPDVKREFSSVAGSEENADAAFRVAEAFTSKCPVCGRKFGIRIAPFRIRKSRYELAECSEHGEFFIRTRAKKNREGKYYSSSIIRFATQNDYFLVASKKEEFDEFGPGGAPVKKPEAGENPTYCDE